VGRILKSMLQPDVLGVIIMLNSTFVLPQMLADGS
jgi:hypothetical protein